jgi:hypothetical protein
VRHPGAILALLSATLVAAACSLFEPSAGPLVNDGSAASACGLGTSGYGTAYGAPSGASATTDFCAADGGTIQGPCDECEAKSCCPERVACYSDQGCSCADEALDTCTGAATGDAAVPTDASDGGGLTLEAREALASCYSTFEAESSIAAARYACLRASCASACEIQSGGF